MPHRNPSTVAESNAMIAYPRRRVFVVFLDTYHVPRADSMVVRKALQDFLKTALGPDDRLLALVSGGGSALLSLPAPGLALEDKQAVNRALLRSGAHIGEMNRVRKHLSAVKGGRLAAAAHPARVHTLLISDVPGDDPATVASGPTVADPTTFATALDTRFGVVSFGRLGLLVGAAAWLWAALRRPRGRTADTPLGPGPLLLGAALGVGLLATPGLAGHASTAVHDDTSPIAAITTTNPAE